MTSETFLDAIVDHVLAAGRVGSGDLLPPAVTLWPDEARQWYELMPQLRPRLPLLTLGDYDPAQRTGPAYWVRCHIARTLPPGVSLPDPLPGDAVPIIYLPGIGKGDLRAIEDCPRPLQPLAELQYRGALWVHRNGRDWSVSGFLHHLGAPVAADAATRRALLRALPLLAREPVERLRREAPLAAEFFDSLLAPDPVRQMLLWLDDPHAFRQGLSPEAWAAFCALARRRFGVDPQHDDPLLAARWLDEPAGEWAVVWQRFAEAPTAFPSLPDLLRQARPATQLRLFDGQPGPYWPQDNEAAEDELRQALGHLGQATADDARARLAALETAHGPRRNWVWAGLGHAPLAKALEHLSALAQLTRQPLGGDGVAAIAAAYAEWGWQVDAAVLRALAVVAEPADVVVVTGALLALYRPWLAAAARRFQDALRDDPAGYRPGEPPTAEPGDCILFCDALRYDVANQLAEALWGGGVEGAVEWQLAALPPVTATAKPAVCPAAPLITGGAPGLTPVARAGGAPVNAESLRRLIGQAGYQVLLGYEVGDPTGRGWTEFGAIDAVGHAQGWKLAHAIVGEVRALAERVSGLLEAGWRRVIVVTDHGWLLLPDGLPKAILPLHQTVARKGRCAVVKPGVQVEEQTVAWHWSADVRIAVAADIHSFEAGQVYEHGGLSPQECVAPRLTAVVRPLAATDRYELNQNNAV